MYKILRVMVVGILVISLIPESNAHVPVWSYDIEGTTAVAMSPNEEYVIIGIEKGEVYLLNNFGELLHFKSLPGKVNCIDIADNANIIVGTEKKLSFYNPLMNKVITDFDILRRTDPYMEDCPEYWAAKVHSLQVPQ